MRSFNSMKKPSVDSPTYWLKALSFSTSVTIRTCLEQMPCRLQRTFSGAGFVRTLQELRSPGYVICASNCNFLHIASVQCRGCGTRENGRQSFLRFVDRITQDLLEDNGGFEGEGRCKKDTQLWINLSVIRRLSTIEDSLAHIFSKSI